MWAGGLDDGTGGVFEEDIPFAEKGPVGPCPVFHTGPTVKEFIKSEMGGGSSANRRRSQKDFSLSGSYRNLMALVCYNVRAIARQIRDAQSTGWISCSKNL